MNERIAEQKVKYLTLQFLLTNVTKNIALLLSVLFFSNSLTRQLKTILLN
jgi:hypothetical protein